MLLTTMKTVSAEMQTNAPKKWRNNDAEKIGPVCILTRHPSCTVSNPCVIIGQKYVYDMFSSLICFSIRHLRNTQQSLFLRPDMGPT